MWMKRLVLVSRTPLLFIFSAVAACSTSMVPQSVEFELVRNVPLIEADVHGASGLKFLIDTGVDPSVIDLHTALKLGLPVNESEVGEASGKGDGQGLEVMRSSILNLAIGDGRYPPIDALAADLSSFSSVLNVELAGILGYSFLDGRAIRIDYRSREIAFAKSADRLPKLTTPTSAEYTIPLRFNSVDDVVPVFTITIAGEPVIVSLDTGKSSGIEFYKPISETLNLKSLVTDTSESSRLGARGERVVSAGKMNSMGIGPFVLKDIPVSFSEESPTAEIRQGNAGNALLQYFVVTIDYTKGELKFAQ